MTQNKYQIRRLIEKLFLIFGSNERSKMINQRIQSAYSRIKFKLTLLEVANFQAFILGYTSFLALSFRDFFNSLLMESSLSRLTAPFLRAEVHYYDLSHLPDVMEEESR